MDGVGGRQIENVNNRKYSKILIILYFPFFQLPIKSIPLLVLKYLRYVIQQQEQVVDFCECGNEPSSFIKWGKFLD